MILTLIITTFVLYKLFYTEKQTIIFGCDSVGEPADITFHEQCYRDSRV